MVRNSANSRWWALGAISLSLLVVGLDSTVLTWAATVAEALDTVEAQLAAGSAPTAVMPVAARARELLETEVEEPAG